MAATKYSGTNDPNYGYVVIDTPAAANGLAIGQNGVAGAPGYDDIPAGGDILTALPASQGKNPIAGANGNVLLDSTNDIPAAKAVNMAATVQGNTAYGTGTAQSPTQSAPTLLQSAQVVINTQMVRLVWKNPA